MKRTKFTPTTWALYQNYPNPFNPSTIIRYNLHEDAFVTISVFNMYGKVHQNIVNEIKKVLVQNLSIGMLPIIKVNLFHQEFIFTELK